MAIYSGNNQYLSVNATVIANGASSTDTVFRKFEMKLATGDEDTSGGAANDWERHAAKLSVIDATMEINMDTEDWDTHLGAVLNSLGRGDVVEVISGPMGNASGMPKHQQSFLVTGVDGPAVNHDRTRVAFNVTMKSTGAPTANFYDGATFS
jgi:hypothetical protein